MDQCSFCGRIFEPDGFDEWRSNVSEPFTLPHFDQVFTFFDARGGEHCACENCYRGESLGVLSTKELAEVHYHFGLEYSQRKRSAEALECLKQAVALDRTPDALGSLAIEYERAGQYPIALALLEDLRSEQPEHSVVVRSLPRLYIANGRPEAALREIDSHRNSRNFDQYMLMTRAQALLALGQAELASESYRLALNWAAKCCDDCVQECHSRWRELGGRLG